MKKNLGWLLIASATFAFLLSQNYPVQAGQSYTYTLVITEAQINTFADRLFSVANPAEENKHVWVIILEGRFRPIFYAIDQETIDAYWITPTAHSGKLVCDFSAIQLSGNFLTKQELTRLSATEKNANVFCYLLLDPFLEGYGRNAQISSIRLSNHSVYIQLTGAELKNAIPPAVVARCKVADFLMAQNLRTGPGLNYPIITLIPVGEWLDYLGQNPGWVKVQYHGAIGWAWKGVLSQTVECYGELN